MDGLFMQQSASEGMMGTERRGENRGRKEEFINGKMAIESENVDYEFDLKKASEGAQKGMFTFLTTRDLRWLLYVTIISIIVRLAFLNHPSVVIFDEVHFGGFAQKYLKGEYFFDLHPPLARLLVTLSAWIGGFNAEFSFYDIGADYLKDSVPYVIMRGFCAVCGAIVAPIAFVTMRGMDIGYQTAIIVAMMIVFENALITQSRLILLDAYLIIFTTLIGFFWMLFRRQSKKPFSKEWSGALLGLGVSMALAASCKWVGLFAVAAIGLHTVVELWNILGDTKVPLRDVSKHLGARVVALIVIPISIYASTFWMHFALLKNFSQSASSMTLEFQQSLKGGELSPTMANVFYGSEVRIRQYRSEGPFLHSHSHLYPEGSKQQQVTGYHHRDRNNLWIIRRAFKVNVTYETEQLDEQEKLTPLHHLDSLRLEHLLTGRFLHSHAVNPPVSSKDKQYEVSCYAHHPSKISDINDNWRIEIVDSRGNPITEDDVDETNNNQTLPILAIGTKFRLVHTMLGCSLHCRNKPLPEWGFKQAEMTCGRETLHSNRIWIIESNTHPVANKAVMKTVTMKPSGFWSKFVETNKSMWRTNAGLSSEHPFGSRPGSWPVLSRGVGFWNGNHVPKTEKQHKASKEENKGKVKEEDSDDIEDKREQARLAIVYTKFKGQQIYLLGNIVVWWTSTGAVALYILIVLAARISKRRQLSFANYFGEKSFLGKQVGFMGHAGFLFIQWLWHFVPFFGMQRQLFLHHYLPALYFAVLLFALMIENILGFIITTVKLTDNNAGKLRKIVLGMYGVAGFYVFWKLAPLGYGLRLSKSQCESIKWLSCWDFDCSNLVDPVNTAIVTGK